MGTLLVLILLASTSNLVLAQEYTAIFVTSGTIPNDCQGQPLEYFARVIIFNDFGQDGRSPNDHPICATICIPEESMANYYDFFIESDTGFVSPRYNAYLRGEEPTFYLCLYPWPDELVEWISPSFTLAPRDDSNPQTVELPFSTWTCSTEPLPRWGCETRPSYISVSNGEPWPDPTMIRFCLGTRCHVRVRDSLHVQTDYRLPCIEFRPLGEGLPPARAQVDIDNIVSWTDWLTLPTVSLESGFTEMVFLDNPPCGTIDTFTVTREGTSVRIRWNTIAELNLSHFEIWRDHAIGGNHLRLVASVSAADSTHGTDYEYVDNDFFSAYLWYTVFQVANDSMRYADMRAYLPWATEADGSPVELPESAYLVGNYPNPFNATTLIEFELPVTSAVSLNIFDINGRLVTTLLDETMAAGLHTISFDGSAFASGIYFARLTAGNYNTTHKMVLLK